MRFLARVAGRSTVQIRVLQLKSPCSPNLQDVTTEVVVNRSPFQTGGFVGAVNTVSSAQKQLAAFQFLAFLSSAAVNAEMSANISCESALKDYSLWKRHQV